MGSMCISSVNYQSHESDLVSLNSKMKTLNEMSKSTKFSSLKISMTYSRQISQKLSETDLKELEPNTNIQQINVHHIQRSYNFQEEQQSFNKLFICKRSDSPITIKSEPRKKHSQKDSQDAQYIQNLDLSFYIQHLNNQAEQEDYSQRSILKSPLDRSFGSFSEKKKVHFARGTVFRSHRSPPKRISTKIHVRHSLK